MTQTFIPGLQLSRAFYQECVRPILNSHFPDLPYAATLLGPGSEILGFDDEMSTDHHWGPRLMLFLDEESQQQYAAVLHETLAHKLPYEFQGYPTNFKEPDPNDNGTQLLAPIDHGPINHRVAIDTPHRFFASYLGYDLNQPLTPADWLTFPQQKLRTIISGAVYHDDIGLEKIRNQFTFYPHDVWLFMLAAGWARIGQEEHLMGRAGFVGDEIGSALLGGRLVRDVMRLCFLMEKTYGPYLKWFGTAFKQLSCASKLEPILRQALHAASWQDRDRSLSQAYEVIAVMHNNLQLTEPLPENTDLFHGRPFQVISGSNFTDALLAQIQDPQVKKIAAHPAQTPIGSIDQFSDNTDLLETVAYRSPLRRIFLDEIK